MLSKSSMNKLASMTRAYEYFSTYKRPYIMFYFRTSQFYPTNAKEIAQFQRMRRFRSKLEKLGQLFFGNTMMSCFRTSGSRTLDPTSRTTFAEVSGGFGSDSSGNRGERLKNLASGCCGSSSATLWQMFEWFGKFMNQYASWAIKFGCISTHCCRARIGNP